MRWWVIQNPVVKFYFLLQISSSCTTWEWIIIKYLSQENFLCVCLLLHIYAVYMECEDKLISKQLHTTHLRHNFGCVQLFINIMKCLNPASSYGQLNTRRTTIICLRTKKQWMVATWRKNDATTAVGNPEEKSGFLVVILSVSDVPRGPTDNSNKEN